MGVHEIAAAVLSNRLEYSQTSVIFCALDGFGAHGLLCCIYLVASFLREGLVPQGWLAHLALALGWCL